MCVGWIGYIICLEYLMMYICILHAILQMTSKYKTTDLIYQHHVQWINGVFNISCSNLRINVKTSVVKVEEIPYSKPQSEQQKTTPLERCCKFQAYKINYNAVILLYHRELCVASRLSTLDNISATTIVIPVVSLVKAFIIALLRVDIT